MQNFFDTDFLNTYRIDRKVINLMDEIGKSFNRNPNFALMLQTHY